MVCVGQSMLANHCTQDFLNGVCTNIVVMQERQMKYWGGNYDTYQRTREEQDINQVRFGDDGGIKHTGRWWC